MDGRESGRQANRPYGDPQIVPCRSGGLKGRVGRISGHSSKRGQSPCDKRVSEAQMPEGDSPLFEPCPFSGRSAGGGPSGSPGHSASGWPRQTATSRRPGRNGQRDRLPTGNLLPVRHVSHGPARGKRAPRTLYPSRAPRRGPAAWLEGARGLRSATGQRPRQTRAGRRTCHARSGPAPPSLLPRSPAVRPCT